MSILDKIKRGGQNLPPRILVSGPQGVGKSTLGASFPNPLFICAEEGLTGLDHVAHISPATFQDILDAVDALAVDRGEFGNIIIDTTDWLERMIYQFVCLRDKKESIEDYGYGKGYVVAEQELVLLLTKLDRLRLSQRVGIVLLSHVEIKPFTSPDGTTYDRYALKGHKRMTGILCEWPDACLFAVNEVFKIKDKGSQKEKTIAGDRIMHTTWSPAWEAKNRLGLPPTLPLDYDALQSAIHDNSPAVLREKFMALLATSTLTEEQRKAWTKTPVEQLAPDRIKAGIEKLNGLQAK